jgi:type I restriction enzyme M protein
MSTKRKAIALANMALHGIDAPNLWHGNTLSFQTQFGGRG